MHRRLISPPANQPPTRTHPTLTLYPQDNRYVTTTGYESRCMFDTFTAAARHAGRSPLCQPPLPLNPKEVKVLRDYEYVLKEVMGFEEDIWQIEDPEEYVRSYVSYYDHSTPGLLHAKVAPSTMFNKLETPLPVMRFQAPNITFTTNQFKALLRHCENLLRKEDPIHSFKHNFKFNLYDTELDLLYTIATNHPNTDYTQTYIVCALAWATAMRPMSYIKNILPRKLPANEREKLEQLDPLR
jgi:hypothetical protein